MNIGLIDVDGRLPNLALMKISTYYKDLGCNVSFVEEGKDYDKIYASAIFTRSKEDCEKLITKYGDKIEIGGTGWDIEKKLPTEIENCKADYDLYSVEQIASRIKVIGTREKRFQKAQQIVDAGIGFTSRGCVRNCSFCFVPKKEGCLKQSSSISDIINPRSNVIILHDNNLTADPNCIDKLHEIRDRNLIVDINQGCDVRLINEDIAQALKEVKHLRSLHYAWDLMNFENQVVDGIKMLSNYIKPYKHMCFILVGFNTTFEEDMYRFKKLRELKVDPFVMVYNQKDDKRLKHFARWVNARIYKSCSWDDYSPWVKVKDRYELGLI